MTESSGHLGEPQATHVHPCRRAALEIWRRYVGIPITEPYDQEFEWLEDRLLSLKDELGGNQPKISLTEAAQKARGGQAMTDLGEPKAMRSNEYLDAEELAWTENKVHDLERAIREIQAWQSSSGVSNEPEHQAKKLYNGRASFEFVKNGIFQTDGFAVIVNRQTIAECEDSEVADWICNAWNTRQAMTDLGESKAVPERWRSDFDGMWKDADGCWVSYEDFEATIREQAQTIDRLTKALQHIKQHQEIVAGNMGGHTSAWNIANTALNYREKI